MKVIKYTFTFSFFVLLACQVKQKKINYGTDHCEFCQMTIVDKQHAAQVVTKKGKAYSFDAIECMVHYSEKMDPSTIGLFLSANFNPPSSLLDATQFRKIYPARWVRFYPRSQQRRKPIV